MNRARRVLHLAAVCLGALTTGSPFATALSREAVMTRAKAYAYHPWHSRTANQTASCNPAYRSANPPGDYLGLPYDWGGYMSLYEFVQQIAAGAGAGSYPDDGVLSCTAGVDCSGFVSRAWGVGHFTTRNLATISTPISTSSLLPGDIFNKSGYHVAIFSHRAANGEPIFYESINDNVHVNVSGGWSWVDGYAPLRHTGITGTTATTPLGTLANPIPITSFPFSDTRDTSQSPSSVLDRCAVAADRNESGPEYVYRVNFTQPGQLTVSASDGPGVDIDVHLYGSANANDCVARHDSTFTRAVGCGEQLIVADTFGGASNAGTYTLTVTFTPSGQPCGTTTPLYQFPGAPGQSCGYPGNTTLPACNPNLGADVCLYTSQASWCTHACDTGADCAEFAGGCCVAIAAGERYCMPASRCTSTDGGTQRQDAGIRGGDPEEDAGVPSPDAGMARDAGMIADAGLTRDAGMTPDAGLTRDAGLARDAGLFEDAGVVVDAGLARDAGLVTDAGSPRDAGTSRRDAGTPDAGTMDAGDPPNAAGGCQSVGDGAAPGLPWLLALALASVLRRRRR